MRAALALAGLAALHANAATVTLCGPNVCYAFDNTQTAIALTGLPTLVGDSVTFLPPSFAALSQNGAGWVTTGGATGNFIFSAVYTVNPLNEITGLMVHEEFDYEIITSGEVRASLYLQARSLVEATDGTSITQNFASAGDSGGNQIATLDATVNPANDFVAIANNMQVGIQNTLRAYSGDYAFIQKKFTLVTQTTVPVPGALWLLGSGLGALAWIRRRTAS